MRKTLVTSYVALALGVVLPLHSLCQTATNVSVVVSEKHNFRVTSLVKGLQYPWSMAFLPDGRMLITEREGRLRIVNRNYQLDPMPISGLPETVAKGQGGLFDVVLHPEYATNGWIYWAYNAPGPGGWGTALARGQLQGHRMTNVQDCTQRWAILALCSLSNAG